MHCTVQDNSGSNMMNDENVMLKRFGVVSLNPQPLCSSYVLFAFVFLMDYALYTKIINIFNFKCVPVWLSGRALRQQRKRLWVRFPGNTHTNGNI